MTNPFDFNSYADFIIVGALAVFGLAGFILMAALGTPDETTGKRPLEDRPNVRKVLNIFVVLPAGVLVAAFSGLVILARIARVIT